jgi:short-subunit dehydrogenase
VRLSETVVLLTGSSGGIGAACAAALSARGAQVVIHGRDRDRLEAVAADLGAKALNADLRDPGGVAQLAHDAREIYGRVDGIVHCAGVGWYGPAAAMPPASIDELIAVNVTAPAQLTRLLLPEMIERGRGHVAFLASIAGWTGVTHEAVYAATKAAIITYADSLRMEIADSGIGVSVVSPAAVHTEFFERRGTPYGRRVPRLVTPQRVAAAVATAIERDRAQQMIPRWLAVAPAVRTALPGPFRRLNRRFGQSQV